MITLVKKLIRFGNSKGFVIDSAIIRSECMSVDKSYKITIEEI